MLSRSSVESLKQPLARVSWGWDFSSSLVNIFLLFLNGHQRVKLSPGTAGGEGIEGRMRDGGRVFHSEGLKERAVERHLHI